MMKRQNLIRLCRGALIAALYVVLTYVSFLFGLASGEIQFRLSEMLTVLPAFFPEATAGLTVGCLLANAVTGSVIWDTVFGTLATLLGALGARFLRRSGNAFLITLPTVLANTVIVPAVIVLTSVGRFVFSACVTVAITVFIGEFVCCSLLGSVLLTSLKKARLLPPILPSSSRKPSIHNKNDNNSLQRG